MYPSLAGVVIPDDDDYEVTFRAQQYGDETADQVLYAQNYGDDGIRDGAEGLGIEQARRLKRKLNGTRRRLRVGRSPYAVEGGSAYQFGFGVAPLVAIGAGKAAVGVVRSLGIGSKYTSATHVKRFQAAAAKGDDVTAGKLIDQAFFHAYVQTGIKDADMWRGILAAIESSAPSKWQGYISNLMVGATATQYDFKGSRVAGVLAPTPSLLPVPPGTVTPILVAEPGVPPPAPGGVTDATGRPAPYFPDVPSPIPPTAGGPPSASETVARAAQDTGEPPLARAGLGLDLKNPMMLVGLAAVALFVIPQMVGGGKRRSRR
jgi:hypothetical protein